MPYKNPEDKKAWDRKRRIHQRAVNRLKVSAWAEENGHGHCVKCGTTEELEWDHIDPGTKDFVISSNYGRTWARLLEELAKCQRLCKPCHIIKTVENKENLK